MPRLTPRVGSTRPLRAAALLLAGIVAGSALVTPVSAHLGRFPHLKKHFLTKKAADARYIRKGSPLGNAETLDGLDSTSFIVNGGLFLVNASWLGWVELEDGDAPSDPATSIEYEGDRSLLHGAATGQRAGLHIELPTALYGRTFQLLGGEYCYDATEGDVADPDAKVASARLRVLRHDGGVGGSTAVGEAIDLTDRNNEACVTLMLPTPVTLTSSDALVLEVEADFEPPGATLGLGRALLILEPTSTSAVVP